MGFKDGDSDEQELDEVNFSDQVFEGLIRESDGATQGVQQVKKKRDAGILTNINGSTMQSYYKESGASTVQQKSEISTQTPKNIEKDKDDEDAYSDEDDPNRGVLEEMDDFAVTGLEKFLDRVAPRVEKLLAQNAKNNIFEAYDVIWEDDVVEESDLVYRLLNPYDFIEANLATQQTLQQLKESDQKAGAQDDDFDDDFNDYKQDLNKKQGQQIETKDGVKLDDNYQVTSMSWSCNGSSIAVGYGKTDHVSWCEHQSVIAVWSVFQRSFDPKKPNVIIEVPNCVTTLEYHPENPLILAGGTINGEIYIWNVDNEDAKDQVQSSFLSKSEADEYFHREPINRIIWVVNDQSYYSQQTYLCTVSSDGKILIWNNPLKYKTLPKSLDNLRYPIKGHMFARVKNNQLQTLSGTYMAIIRGHTSLEEDSFIVGTEGGMIQKCLIKRPGDEDVSSLLTSNSSVAVTWSQEAIQFLGNIYDRKNIQKIKNEVDKFMRERGQNRQVYANHIFSSKPPIHQIYPPFNSKQCAAYDKHHGPVMGVSSSPFLRRLFLTCSSDGSVRLYDVQDKRAIVSFEPSFGEYLMSVEWSPFRPSVFATVSNLGNVFIYDLVQSKQKPVEILKFDDGRGDYPQTSSTPLKYRSASQICFNPRQRDFVSVGYYDKTVRIYRLSRILSNQNKDDLRVLKGLLEKEEKKINE